MTGYNAPIFFVCDCAFVSLQIMLKWRCLVKPLIANQTRF